MVRNTLATASQWTISSPIPAGMTLTVSPPRSPSHRAPPGASDPVAKGAALYGWQTGSVHLTEARAGARGAPAARRPLGGRHELSVSKSGIGSGRVTSSPPGIDCGTDCTATFVEDT